MAVEFPASTVLSSFRLVEQMIGKIVRVVPYSPEHEAVWSPHLATVLLESCSQLDSLWQARSRAIGTTSTAQPNVIDYFLQFGSDHSRRWVVFWGEEGMRIQPFSPWDVVGAYDRASFQSLNWWQAYNAVKHDRLANRKQATLRHAVHAVAGLFVAILRSRECAAAIAQEGWIPSPGRLGLNAEDLLADESPAFGIVAESSLFSHPVNLAWKPGPPRPVATSVRSGSFRFQSWCAENGLLHWSRE